MSEGFVVREPEGSISVPATVLARLVVSAAELTEGARVRRPRRGLTIAIEDGHASVALSLRARYGAALPDLAREVQERVSEALRSTCGVEVAAVDVSIEEVFGGR
ncbi:MAG: Asp23/Gls24 family envelope stress response protein [Gaiellaceae bacterium]